MMIPISNRPVHVPLLAIMLLFATGFAFGCAEPASNDAPDEETMPVELSGAALYTTYCQGCHGSDAKGEGPVSELLTTSPPDLTTLVAKYGEFPEELVSGTIDGRGEVRGHGTREMPVWGNIWNDPMGGPLSEERVDAQITSLVEYIRDLQAEP